MTHPTSLFNRNFVLLWQGQLASQIGSQAFAVAMMLWLKGATGSATVMGSVMMVSMLPGVIAGPVGGTFADLHSRRAIIILTDVLRGLAALSLFGILWSGQHPVEFAVAWLFMVSGLVATLGAFFNPAVLAAIPDLVPADKVTAANSLHQSSSQIALLLGQAVGGILFRLLGAPFLFCIDGLSYLLSALSEAFISIPPVRRTTQGGQSVFRVFRANLIEGFRFVWSRSGVRTLFLAASVYNFFIMPILLLLPFYVEDVLDVRPDWYGFLLAGLGAGSLIGFAVAGAITCSGAARSKLMIALMISMSLALATLGQVRTAPVALLLIAGVGAMSGTFNVNVLSILQITTPGDMRGRVFGLLGTLSGALATLGMLLGGVIGDLTQNNIPAIYLACGLLACGFAVAASLSGEFRVFLAQENTPSPETDR